MDWKAVLTDLIDIGNLHPDLLSLAVGTLAGFVLTIVLERYFLPTACTPASQRLQQGCTFLFCWWISALICGSLWWVLDGKALIKTRIVISLVVSIFPFPGYPFLARMLASRWSAFGTAWTKITDHQHPPDGTS